MTNPACVEALVQALRDYTDRITIVEADSGGYNRFSIDEVFARTGLKDLEKRYGVVLANLSHLPAKQIEIRAGRRRLQLPVPRLLAEEADLFITVPVPKIHMNTRVSLSTKNQWGCIPEPSLRLKLHPFFPKVIHEINKVCKTRLSVVDGKYGLNRSGPMRGDPVELGWTMIGDNIYAVDVTCCHLMQVHPRDVYYLRYIDRFEERLPALDSIEFSTDYQPFIKEKFYLEREWTDLPGQFAFRSSLLAYIAYDSPLAGILHKLLYLFREPFYDYSTPEQTEK